MLANNALQLTNKKVVVRQVISDPRKIRIFSPHRNDGLSDAHASVESITPTKDSGGSVPSNEKPPRGGSILILLAALGISDKRSKEERYSNGATAAPLKTVGDNGMLF